MPQKKRRDLDREHARPAGLDDTTVEALGILTEALERVERARGHLYAMHQLTGGADLALDEAVRLFNEAGHHELAELETPDLVGRAEAVLVGANHPELAMRVAVERRNGPCCAIVAMPLKRRSQRTESRAASNSTRASSRSRRKSAVRSAQSASCPGSTMADCASSCTSRSPWLARRGTGMAMPSVITPAR